MTKCLFYRLVPHNGGAVFAPAHRARTIATIHRALREAATWGEFRRLMPPLAYERLIRRAYDENDEPPPVADDPFRADDIGGFSEGDYPDWLQAEMDMVIPEALLRRFGKLTSTFVNGEYWHIPEESMEAMVNPLRERGFEAVHIPDLPFH